jgi:hypothetical protein
LTGKAVTAYREILDEGAQQGVFRRCNGALLFAAVVGMCEFFVAGTPILRLALGKDVEPRTMSARYQDFILELLLNGLRSRAEPVPGS